MAFFIYDKDDPRVTCVGIVRPSLFCNVLVMLTACQNSLTSLTLVFCSIAQVIALAVATHTHDGQHLAAPTVLHVAALCVCCMFKTNHWSL